MSHAVWYCRCTILLVSSHAEVNLDPGGKEVCFAEINGNGQVQRLLADSSLTTVCNSSSGRCISLLLALWRALTRDLYIYVLTALFST